MEIDMDTGVVEKKESKNKASYDESDLSLKHNMKEERIQLDSALPGQQLRKAREAKGFSIENVADELKITVAYTRAIENDDYEKLPEPAFIKGYIRGYARYVETSGDEVVELFGKLTGEIPQSSIKGGAEKGSVSEQLPTVLQSALQLVVQKTTKEILLVVVVVAAAAGLYLTSPPPPLEAEGLTVEETIAVDRFDVAQELGEPSAEKEIAAEGEKILDDGSVGTIDKPVIKKVITTAVDSDKASIPVSGASESTVHINFSESCWVEIKDANQKILYSKIANIGEVVRVSGVAPIRVLLGNAQAATVKFNDKPVKIKATSNNVANLTLKP